MTYRPQDVAYRLGISPSTLRLWSNQFANELSNAARKVPMSGSGTMAQRRYTDEDLRRLSHVKDLLGQGLTYDETKRRLREERQPKEQRESRELREPWEQRESRELREPRELRESRDQREPRELSDPWEQRQPRVQREPRDLREQREQRDSRQQRETRDEPVERPAPRESRSAAVSSLPDEVLMSLDALKEALAAKDKTINALKDSLAFVDVYLHTMREEREEARERVRHLERELEGAHLQSKELARQLTKPWFRRLLGMS